MGIRNVKVSAYTRQDGTAVATHNRRIVNKFPFISSKRQKQSLFALAGQSPRPTITVPSLSKVNASTSEIDREFYDSIDRNEERLLYNQTFWGASGSVGIGAFIVSIPLALAFPPAIGIGGVCGILGVVAPILITGLSNVRHFLRRGRRLRKFFRESRPSRKDLKNVAASDQWDASSPYAQRTLREKLFGTRHVRQKHNEVKTVSHSKLIHGGVQVKYKKLGDATCEAYFVAGTDCSEERFAFPVDLRGANLRDINLSRSYFFHGIFDGADLRGANLERMSAEQDSSFRDANLEGANLEGAELREADLQGCDLSKSTLDSDTRLPSDLTGIGITGEQFDLLRSGYEKDYTYPNTSFEDAVKILGITDKKFEFLVLSGVVEVRDNWTQERIDRGFDPSQHHVPPWSLDKVKEMLAGEEPTAQITLATSDLRN